MTAFIYSPSFLNHKTGPGHPESPLRLKAIHDRLENSPLLNELQTISPEAVGRKAIQLVHEKGYADHVEVACSRGVRFLDTGDTVVCPESYIVALHAAGGVLDGIRLIFENSGSNAFCAVRPPGHHAGVNTGMGFCLFNNAAIGARFAQKEYGVNRVMILDWDVHHGNGTQNIFESDPSVFYVSIHQYPFYPGTGSETETGSGDGLGTTRNFPLSAGLGDEEYLDIFENSIPELAAEFSPELIIVSSGFDAHHRDPLASMRVSTETFIRMTEVVVKMAGDMCHGRLLSVLEGGYDLESLAECVEAHLSVLTGIETDGEGNRQI